MARLSISLEEGFDNDTVVVSVNGTEHYRRGGVSTKLQVGLADLFEVDAENGPVTIDVNLPVKRVSGRHEVDASSDLYVGVSVGGSGLRFRHSSQTFGYA